ncbi:MAG TPA: amino acid deaminase [Acidobacteriaceae bacterium]|nr:amino acid deaminase [Acidobacteriaceae bacterium]
MNDPKYPVPAARTASAIEPYHKGLSALMGPIDPQEIAALGWNLLREDLDLPVAVLYWDRLRHNQAWMQQFIAAYNVKLAPHGKTTMAPKLFELQLKGGAWGITLATAQQTMAAYRHGVRRVLLANQLIGKQNIMIIARLLQDPGFDFYCLVDSEQQIEQLGRHFQAAGGRLQVLMELGVEGGRAGVRNAEQAEAVLNAIERWRPHLSLCGLEIYEGILEDEASIRAFLGRTVAAARELIERKKFDRHPILLSGAGSAWYDVVAEVFSGAGLGEAAEIVLRPGCYLTHDAGVYRAAQRAIEGRNPIAREIQGSLLPALQVWAYVQSIPEEGRAIVGLGKRDAAFDLGLPMPALHYRPGETAPIPAPTHWKLTRMMDQHAYLQIEKGDRIAVGDMIGFDISHPCLTFDRWRYLPVLDGEFRITDLVETFF